ncbi:hypothetical protein LINPERHAP1_LOCUS27536 [Linum perenne]
MQPIFNRREAEGFTSRSKLCRKRKEEKQSNSRVTKHTTPVQGIIISPSSICHPQRETFADLQPLIFRLPVWALLSAIKLGIFFSLLQKKAK